MSPFSNGLPGIMEDAGLVLGLVVSLMIGSYVVRDSFLARLGQYILVGAGLGYTVVLVWRNVLWPRLFAPLLADPMSWQSAGETGFLNLWLPFVLGVLMWGGGLELLRRPPERLGGRRVLRLLAAVPAAILGGVVMGVAVSGAVQGTLWPQLDAAVAAADGQTGAGQARWLVRFLTLLITGGVLIHLQFGPNAGGGENGSSGSGVFGIGGRGSGWRRPTEALQSALSDAAARVGGHRPQGAMAGCGHSFRAACSGAFRACCVAAGLFSYLKFREVTSGS